jgi:MFS family permease
VLAQKLGWEQHGLFNNVVLTTIMGPIGIALGSLVSGFVSTKMSLKNMLLLSNFLAIFANVIKIQEFTSTILLGRFLFGLCAGLMNFCFGKALNETIPQEFSQKYGMLVNAGICFGIFVSNLMGLFIPIENSNDPLSLEKMQKDQNWRIVFGTSIFLEVFSLVAIPVMIKEMSLKNLLQTSLD